MADTLATKLNISFEGVLQNSLTNSLGTVTANIVKSIALSLADGTTTGKADKIWGAFDRSLSGATSETIDVYDFGSIDIGAGAGKDPLAGALALAEICLLIVVNDSTSTGTLTVGADGTTAAWNSWCNADDDGAITLKPGMFQIIGGAEADPAYAVADSSNHLLKMASSATLTYDIIIVGRSA